METFVQKTPKPYRSNKLYKNPDHEPFYNVKGFKDVNIYFTISIFMSVRPYNDIDVPSYFQFLQLYNKISLNYLVRVKRGKYAY